MSLTSFFALSQSRLCLIVDLVSDHKTLQAVLIQYCLTGSIVAVHGLGSDPDTTWKSRRNLSLEKFRGPTPSENQRLWLNEFLPEDLRKVGFSVRIMTFNHNTRWTANAVNKSLFDFAEDLLRELSANRQSAEVSDCLT